MNSTECYLPSWGSQMVGALDERLDVCLEAGWGGMESGEGPPTTKGAQESHSQGRTWPPWGSWGGLWWQGQSRLTPGGGWPPAKKWGG